MDFTFWDLSRKRRAMYGIIMSNGSCAAARLREGG